MAHTILYLTFLSSFNCTQLSCYPIYATMKHKNVMKRLIVLTRAIIDRNDSGNSILACFENLIFQPLWVIRCVFMLLHLIVYSKCVGNSWSS